MDLVLFVIWGDLFLVCFVILQNYIIIFVFYINI